MYKSRVTYDEWKCISDKSREGKIISTDSFEGYVGLLNINKVEESQRWNYNGEIITVCDDGYKWLTVLPKNERYCITIMMDSEYGVKVSYIDFINSQGIDEDGVPFFYDIYLDFVVYPDGTIIVDDMDELEQAVTQNDISIEQYNKTLEAADKLKNTLLCDMQKYDKFIKNRLQDVRNNY